MATSTTSQQPLATPSIRLTPQRSSHILAPRRTSFNHNRTWSAYGVPPFQETPNKERAKNALEASPQDESNARAGSVGEDIDLAQPSLDGS